ncbi:hypothetical protein Q0Z83_036390 [Actinoplanes sichuanensis]|uniref:Uncharacterized protein n=1 Tax=Actinoplanes sichuanensis TaxID=512349 RepID=A0ABW4AUS2_9ACTN|nr:hypothetical protein [Actinoplanes sichuanensis]BEL05448.1 hypothetical protein Q0Z83_036390 [Actinoplanes sichuanensis]
MEADELAEVDQQLRSICVQRGLGWVVSQVDGLISQGRDAFTSDESYYQGRPGYSNGYPLFASGNRPPPANPRSVPFTPTDQTLMLIDAVLAIFIHLPAMQATAIRTLRQGFEGRASVVGSVSFADEGQDQAVTTISDGEDIDYEALIATLRRLREEVAPT